MNDNYSLNDALRIMTNTYCMSEPDSKEGSRNATNLVGLVTNVTKQRELDAKQREFEYKKELDAKRLEQELSVKQQELEIKKLEIEVRKREAETREQELEGRQVLEEERLKQESTDAVKNRRIEIAKLIVSGIPVIVGGIVGFMCFKEGDMWSLLKRQYRNKAL